MLTLTDNMTLDAAHTLDKLYILTPPMPTSEIGGWAAHFAKYDQIAGYSIFGHFFLRSEADNDYLVLHPFKKAAKSYGSFPNVVAFEEAILKDPGFSAYVLRPSHAAAVTQLLGPLDEGEIYIPAPYPFQGGTEAPDSYSKGNVWVFMDIVAQMHGL